MFQIQFSLIHFKRMNIGMPKANPCVLCCFLEGTEVKCHRVNHGDQLCSYCSSCTYIVYVNDYILEVNDHNHIFLHSLISIYTYILRTLYMRLLFFIVAFDPIALGKQRLFSYSFGYCVLPSSSMLHIHRLTLDSYVEQIRISQISFSN